MKLSENLNKKIQEASMTDAEWVVKNVLSEMRGYSFSHLTKLHPKDIDLIDASTESGFREMCNDKVTYFRTIASDSFKHTGGRIISVRFINEYPGSIGITVVEGGDSKHMGSHVGWEIIALEKKTKKWVTPLIEKTLIDVYSLAEETGDETNWSQETFFVKVPVEAKYESIIVRKICCSDYGGIHDVDELDIYIFR